MIYIASDHAGFQLKKEIIKYIKTQLNKEVEDWARLPLWKPMISRILLSPSPKPWPRIKTVLVF